MNRIALPPIRREEIPLGIAGKGTLNISAVVPSLQDPLPPESANLFAIGFGLSGSTPMTFGRAGSATLTIEADTQAKISAIFPDSSGPEEISLLSEYGLSDYFRNHPGQVLMSLRLGASADASLDATIRYQALSVQGTINTGADGGYTLIKPYPAATPAGTMLVDFIKGIRMPANSTSPLEQGEVIAYEYGGYLRLGASVSLGYEMQGAPSFRIAELDVSETYSLGLLGTVGIQASIAGRFAVQVRGVAPPEDMPADQPGKWVRVTVQRRRSKQFTAAADVRLRVDSQLNGLPDSSDEFLGALLGVNGRSWLTYLQTFEAKVQEFASLDKLAELGDSLSRQFIERLVGTSFDQIRPQLDVVLPKLQRIVNAYQSADQKSVALFDRFWDRIETTLMDRLNDIRAAGSWQELLGGIVNPDLARTVEILSGGDPLPQAAGFAGSPAAALESLKRAAQMTLNAIQSRAHEPIVEAITLAKQAFGLDPLFETLESIDTEEELRAKASDLAGAFASRLIGKAVDELRESELDDALARIRKIVAGRREFQERLYAKFQQLAEQSLQFSLHSEFTRSSEREALMDVLLNLDEEKGRQLFGPAAEGDFSGLMEAYRPPEHASDPNPAAGFRPAAVRILEGSLTHRTRRETAFRVNVIGWHRNWFYQGFDRVITQTEQQIKTDESGSLTVHTTIELGKEKERSSGLTGSEERMYTNFVLRFLGESSGALAVDKHNQQFLIDVIRSIGARYHLSFQDEKTTPEELKYYLSFARDFGLAGSGATFENIAPMLPLLANRNFGPVDAAYQIAFSEEGLRKIFTKPLEPAKIRHVMRSIVMVNYIREETPLLADIAWCYATPEYHEMFRQMGPQFDSVSHRRFSPIAPPPVPAPLDTPKAVTLNRHQLLVLSTLYRIEDRFVAAFQSLARLLQQPATAPRLSPAEFEERLQDFGSALKSFDDFDEGVNTVFAVFDQLIRLSGGEALHASTLRLTSRAEGREVQKIFIKAAEQAATA